MGDLGDGPTDTLDERMWGDEEDDDEESSDKEEESGQGMDQVITQEMFFFFKHDSCTSCTIMFIDLLNVKPHVKSHWNISLTSAGRVHVGCQR